MTIRTLVAALLFSCILVAGSRAANAQETGWSTAVLPTSPEAQQIRQQGILDRPNRPGHVFGNTVRRMYYRGHPLPMPVYRSGGPWRRW